MQPERRMVRQCRATSASLGITESKGLIFTGTCFDFITVNNSAKPKAPTRAGTSAMPPARSRLPKVKRSKA